MCVMTPFVKKKFDFWMTIDVQQVKRGHVHTDMQGSTFVNRVASDPTQSMYWVRYLRPANI